MLSRAPLPTAAAGLLEPRAPSVLGSVRASGCPGGRSARHPPHQAAPAPPPLPRRPPGAAWRPKPLFFPDSHRARQAGTRPRPSGYTRPEVSPLPPTLPIADCPFSAVSWPAEATLCPGHLLSAAPWLAGRHVGTPSWGRRCLGGVPRPRFCKDAAGHSWGDVDLSREWRLFLWTLLPELPSCGCPVPAAPRTVEAVSARGTPLRGPGRRTPPKLSG